MDVYREPEDPEGREEWMSREEEEEEEETSASPWRLICGEWGKDEVNKDERDQKGRLSSPHGGSEGSSKEE